MLSKTSGDVMSNTLWPCLSLLMTLELCTVCEVTCSHTKVSLCCLDSMGFNSSTRLVYVYTVTVSGLNVWVPYITIIVQVSFELQPCTRLLSPIDSSVCLYLVYKLSDTSACVRNHGFIHLLL